VDERGWTPGFFEKLEMVDEQIASAFTRSMSAARAGRRSKRPPTL